MVIGDIFVFFFFSGWFGLYGNGADCIWIIYVFDFIVEFNIFFMDIEVQLFCFYDKLIIKDGKKYCRNYFLNFEIIVLFLYQFYIFCIEFYRYYN